MRFMCSCGGQKSETMTRVTLLMAFARCNLFTVVQPDHYSVYLPQALMALLNELLKVILGSSFHGCVLQCIVLVIDVSRAGVCPQQKQVTSETWNHCP